MSENGHQETTTAVEKTEENNKDENNEDLDHDPHYEPIISLPEIEVPTLEEEEIVLVNMRAKLYRYDSKEDPPEWKERGTGTVKILHHKANETVRVVMRRDKTLKLCANHFITPFMELKPSSSCERAWVYSVKADYADETAKSEFLAIKFANVENASRWKEIFDEAKKLATYNEKSKLDETNEDEKEILSSDAPKLNDTFEDEKKTILDEKESKTPKKQINSELTEKLSSLTVQETKAESN